jgi:peptidoglycan/LPS O-acetylase OafA/YrhL
MSPGILMQPVVPPVSRTSSPGRIPALDGLRGIAILLVLFHHLSVYDPAGPIGTRLSVIAEFASHGVDLFFALSGFLIARQLAGIRSVPGFAPRFWLHRAAKIVPLYFLVVFAVFGPLKELLTLSGYQEKLRWLLAARQNWPWYVFFLSNVHNAIDARFTNPALDVCWSLGIEVQFYLLAYFVARLVSPSRWPRVAIYGIVAAILFRVGEVMLGTAWVPILVLTPGRLDAFGFGIVAALAPAWLARCPLSVAYSLLAMPFLTHWSRTDASVQIIGYTYVALAAGVFIERASRPTPNSISQGFLTSRWLGFLGQISYSIYIIHLPIRAALRDLLLPSTRILDSPEAWVAQGAYYLGTGLVCVGAGWFTWKFIEEPSRLALLRLSKGR